MKTAKLLILIVLFTASVATAAPQQKKFPDGPGKAEVTTVCSGCHEAELVLGKIQPRTEWDALLERMASQGAQATDAQWAAILNYLVRNFSGAPEKINVNTTSAKDLEALLILTVKEAQAIVEYREKNGKIKSFDDLLKVPGIDAKDLESKKDKIVFD